MRLQEIIRRLAEIRSEIETRGNALSMEELATLEAEVAALNAEKSQIEAAAEARSRVLEAVAAGDGSEATTPNVLRSFAGAEGAEQQEERAKKNYRTLYLKRLMGKELTEAEQRDFSSASDSAGGVIPEQTANLIVQKMKEKVPLLAEVQLLHIAGSVKFSVEGTIADAVQHTENAAITPDTDALVTVTLAGYEIVKLVRISGKVHTMAVDAFETWLVDMLTDKISEKIESYIINGAGSTEPKGMAALTYADGTNAVKYATAKPTATEVANLISMLPSRHGRKAVFIMHRTTLWRHFMPIRDDAKAPIVSGDAANGYYIYGYPVRLSDSVTVGDTYFGNLKMIVANLSQEVEVSASAASGFLHNAIDYRGTAIFDCTVADTEAFVKGYYSST